MTWQPIETAPKGVPVLLFTRNGIIEGYLDSGLWEQNIITSNYDMFGTSFESPPTHWCELLESPK